MLRNLGRKHKCSTKNLHMRAVCQQKWPEDDTANALQKIALNDAGEGDQHFLIVGENINRGDNGEEPAGKRVLYTNARWRGAPGGRVTMSRVQEYERGRDDEGEGDDGESTTPEAYAECMLSLNKVQVVTVNQPIPVSTLPPDFCMCIEFRIFCIETWHWIPHVTQ
jgi:hypothetical protein